MSCMTCVNLGPAFAFEVSSSVDFNENETELPSLAIAWIQFKKKSKRLPKR